MYYLHRQFQILSQFLQILKLQENHLSGTIPQSIGSLVHLTELWLDHNQLSGAIPDSLTQLGTTLLQLQLQQNNLNGTIPISIALDAWATP